MDPRTLAQLLRSGQNVTSVPEQNVTVVPETPSAINGALMRAGPDAAAILQYRRLHGGMPLMKQRFVPANPNPKEA